MTIILARVRMRFYACLHNMTVLLCVCNVRICSLDKLFIQQSKYEHAEIGYISQLKRVETNLWHVLD